MNESAYWDLHEQAVDALRRGDLIEAEEAFVLSRRCARESQLPGLADRAYCNWAAIRLERNELAGLRMGLSRVLGESPDLRARQLAAYQLTTYYRTRGNLRLARFYAEMSCQLAEKLGDDQIRATTLHCLGLLWTAESRLETGRDCLRKSLELRVKREMSVHTWSPSRSTAIARPCWAGGLRASGSWTSPTRRWRRSPAASTSLRSG